MFVTRRFIPREGLSDVCLRHAARPRSRPIHLTASCELRWQRIYAYVQRSRANKSCDCGGGFGQFRVGLVAALRGGAGQAVVKVLVEQIQRDGP